jgi:DNA-binding NarL/FixJ family response regulator
MAQGETNYGIARHLHITEGTAKTHVSNILHKLGASNRAQAVSRWSGR